MVVLIIDPVSRKKRTGFCVLVFTLMKYIGVFLDEEDRKAER
jgi:hypothetical protein